MNNPDVSINKLFASVRKSMKKYDAEEKVAKEQRQHKKNRRQNRKSLFMTAASSDQKPLFESSLRPRWQSQAHAAKPSDERSATTAPSLFSMTPLKPSWTPGGIAASSAIEDSDCTSIEDDDALSRSSPATAPAVSQTEMDRRAAVSAALRSKSAQITSEAQASQAALNIKPLSWDKPSFKFKAKLDDDEVMINDDNRPAAAASDEIRIQQGKRQSPFGITTQPPQDITSTSYSGISNSKSPYSYPFHDQSELSSDLVDFADKWITPNMSKRGRR